jgi:hypothetical protein
MHFATLLRPIQDHQSTGATGDAAVLPRQFLSAVELIADLPVDARGRA